MIGMDLISAVGFRGTEAVRSGTLGDYGRHPQTEAGALMVELAERHQLCLATSFYPAAGTYYPATGLPTHIDDVLLPHGVLTEAAQLRG